MLQPMFEEETNATADKAHYSDEDVNWDTWWGDYSETME